MFYGWEILRAYASVMGPIEFGFLLMVAMTISYAMMASRLPKLPVIGGIAGLAGALFVTVSRGPWLGAVVSAGMFVISGPKGFSRGFIAGCLGILIFAGAALSPMGDRVIALLPFVGTEEGEKETFDYREQLFRNGSQVIMENPLFGSTNYLKHSENAGTGARPRDHRSRQQLYSGGAQPWPDWLVVVSRYFAECGLCRFPGAGHFEKHQTLKCLAMHGRFLRSWWGSL